MFNISNSVVEKRRFERESSERGQNFKFKYRVGKAGSYFVIAESLFGLLALESHSAAVVPSKDKDGKVESVAIVILPEDDKNATFFLSAKGGKKGRKYNNSLLEKYLVEAGTIVNTAAMQDKDQKLDLQKWDNNVVINEDGSLAIDPKGFPLYIIVLDTTEYGEEVEGAVEDDEPIAEMTADEPVFVPEEE